MELANILTSYPEFTVKSTGKICSLNRIEASHCELCDRTHDSDNTHFMIKADGIPYMLCHKYNAEHSDSKMCKNLFTQEMLVGMEDNMYARLEYF